MLVSEIGEGANDEVRFTVDIFLRGLFYHGLAASMDSQVSLHPARFGIGFVRTGEAQYLSPMLYEVTTILLAYALESHEPSSRLVDGIVSLKMHIRDKHKANPTETAISICADAGMANEKVAVRLAQLAKDAVLPVFGAIATLPLGVPEYGAVGGGLLGKLEKPAFMSVGVRPLSERLMDFMKTRELKRQWEKASEVMAIVQEGPPKNE